MRRACQVRRMPKTETGREAVYIYRGGRARNRPLRRTSEVCCRWRNAMMRARRFFGARLSCLHKRP